MSDEDIEKTEEIIETESEGIKIADDVVATIAGKAVSEVNGVASMFGGFARRNNRSTKRKEKPN